MVKWPADNDICIHITYMDHGSPIYMMYILLHCIIYYKMCSKFMMWYSSRMIISMFVLFIFLVCFSSLFSAFFWSLHNFFCVLLYVMKILNILRLGQFCFAALANKCADSITDACGPHTKQWLHVARLTPLLWVWMCRW